MNTAINVDSGLFDGGPPLRWQKSLRLIKSPTERCATKRALASIAVCWLPLAVMAPILAAFGHATALSFYTDVEVHARFLVAVPLLILAETRAIPPLGKVVRQFLSAGLVDESDRASYNKAVNSTRRLLESRATEVAAFLMAYVIAVILTRNLNQLETKPWYWTSSGPVLGLSPAGLWHAFVSLPLLLLHLLGWLWRVILWWRFLRLMARLDLKLIPAHPDQAGGLRFVSASIRGFYLLAIAVGSIVAAAEIDLIFRNAITYPGFKKPAMGVVGFVLLLALGPLLTFFARLREARAQGIFRYGALVRYIGAEFERKWLDRTVTFDASDLDLNDFSAMTDINQVAGNVYQMNAFPFGWRDVMHLILAALVPFIPVALMTVPLSDILEALEKLLL
jgi:hypothetical protein